MSQRSFAFDAQNGDRSYDAAAFARLFEALTGRDGIIAGSDDELAVVASSPAAMTVEVGLGEAWIQGRHYNLFSAAEVLTVPAADATNPRIDRVVVRLDTATAARTIELSYKAGTPAATPSAPSLERNATAWEISLAQVAVAAVATSIDPVDVTDERSDETLCGFVQSNLPFSSLTPIEEDPGYHAFGFSVEIGDSLLHIARKGTKHAGDVGSVFMWKSTDQGATWTATEIFSSAFDDRNLAGGISGAGTLIAFVARHEPVGDTWEDILPLRSTDGGVTWTAQTAISVGTDTVFSPYGPLVVLPSGKLMQTFYGNDGTNYRIWVQFSSDDGVTWGSEVVLFTSTTMQLTEVAAVLVGGTADASARILAVSRDDVGRLAQMTSDDGGATWTAPIRLLESQGIADVAPWVRKLHDGRILLLWTNRDSSQYTLNACVTDGNAAFEPVHLASGQKSPLWGDPWAIYQSNLYTKAGAGAGHFGYASPLFIGPNIESVAAVFYDIDRDQAAPFGGLDTVDTDLWLAPVFPQTSYRPRISRSYVRAFKNAVQSITSTATKVSFQATDEDERLEWDTTNNRFTAEEPGVYLVSVSIYWDTQVDGNITNVWLYKNAVEEQLIDRSAVGAAAQSTIGGAVPVRLDALDTLEIYASSANTVNLLSGIGTTYVEITRIAD